MTTQTELPIPIRIPSVLGKRQIQLTSLRPGDWVMGLFAPSVVIQNSCVLRRIEVRYEDGEQHVHEYSSFARHTYLGQGKKRLWWPLLPKWAQKHIAPYSKP